MISRPADYFITCCTVLTRPNEVETAVHAVTILGFQFGLYHIVVSLSFLRIISDASLFYHLKDSIGERLPNLLSTLA